MKKRTDLYKQAHKFYRGPEAATAALVDEIYEQLSRPEGLAQAKLFEPSPAVSKLSPMPVLPSSETVLSARRLSGIRKLGSKATGFFFNRKVEQPMVAPPNTPTPSTAYDTTAPSAGPPVFTDKVIAPDPDSLMSFKNDAAEQQPDDTPPADA